MDICPVFGDRFVRRVFFFARILLIVIVSVSIKLMVQVALASKFDDVRCKFGDINGGLNFTIEVKLRVKIKAEWV